MPEPHYSLAMIRAAFWKMFNDGGEHWFKNAEYTEARWQELREHLATVQHERLAPVIAAILAMDGVSGNLHAIVDEGNCEDEHLRACEPYIAENFLEMIEEQLALERACLAALWPLTPYEREMAIEQVEAEELEAFYQKYPERRP